MILGIYVLIIIICIIILPLDFMGDLEFIPVILLCVTFIVLLISLIWIPVQRNCDADNILVAEMLRIEYHSKNQNAEDRRGIALKVIEFNSSLISAQTGAKSIWFSVFHDPEIKKVELIH
jgi:hypothetical protein